MLPVRPEAELRTLKECLYRYPAETLVDVHQVRSVFSDLRLFVDFFYFPNREKRRLVHLAGTVPVLHQGSCYDIPVCIWLHETHPQSRPRCSVRPSVSMVINPACSCVDATGLVHLDGLRNWTHGSSSLLLLVSEMVQRFQKDTPLYSRSAVEVPGPRTGTSGWSYTEDLKGIDFGPPLPPSSSSGPSGTPSSSSEGLSRTLGALTLTPRSSGDTGTAGTGQQAPASGPSAGTRPDPSHPGAQLDRARTVLLLMSMPGRSFSLADVEEAVRVSTDLPSALRYLSHSCPICQEQVSFSQVVPMTHCCCFLCQSCFRNFFSSAIKEKSVDQLVCPLCGQPEVSSQGHMELMDYFSLLDTQIRHFLPAQDHELFQRKLRDRALQEMPTFRWCSHCSFGVLHEADHLRMDCPSCKKSTCSQCRSPWSPQHQGVSCQQFQLWQQQQNRLDPLSTRLGYQSIECPRCQSVFSLSRGGCLHLTCTQCRHQFCGGCSRRFSLGPDCRFSSDCGSRGLHAHHPRDCLYHLRDWPVSRLHLLLQHYRVSPACLDAADGGSAEGARTGTCTVPELREDSSGQEEPCGRAALPEHRGYCQGHYKERLVELINRLGCDPVVVFSPAEVRAELQRWNQEAPPRGEEEAEPEYLQRLRLTLTSRVPLRKHQWWLARTHGNRQPPSASEAAEAPPPHLLTD